MLGSMELHFNAWEPRRKFETLRARPPFKQFQSLEMQIGSMELHKL